MCVIRSVDLSGLLHITKPSRKRLLVTKTQYEDISKQFKSKLNHCNIHFSNMHEPINVKVGLDFKLSHTP